ncbi:YbaN family protein [Aeoliella sp. SH292]|uniref:YbaN family protein n=1 Tax=Aeoliella sp. SH292 TaxID=3454464 RepID=UPI003F94CBF5
MSTLTVQHEGAAIAYVQGARRMVYLGLAGVFLTLALAGVILPGLPTTPFVLLASYFLSRSWPRLNEKLMASKLLGPVLRDWQQHRAVSLRVKLIAITMVLAAVSLIVYRGEMSEVLLMTVVAAAVVGLTVIYRLPTRKMAS